MEEAQTQKTEQKTLSPEYSTYLRSLKSVAEGIAGKVGRDFEISERLKRSSREDHYQFRYDRTFKLEGDLEKAFNALDEATSKARQAGEKSCNATTRDDFWDIVRPVTVDIGSSNTEGRWHPVSREVSWRLVPDRDKESQIKRGQDGEPLTLPALIDVSFTKENNGAVKAHVVIENEKALEGVKRLAARKVGMKK